MMFTTLYLPRMEWEQSFQIGSPEFLDSGKRLRLDKPTYSEIPYPELLNKF